MDVSVSGHGGGLSAFTWRDREKSTKYLSIVSPLSNRNIVMFMLLFPE
jgi:hypothetical protein